MVNKNINKKEIIKTKKIFEITKDFIDSRNFAIIITSNKVSRVLFWLSILFIIIFGYWVSNTSINKLTRGMGKVIPSNKIQSIQNLEGGIISKIFVKSGDMVKKNDILIKLDDKNFMSKAEEHKLKIYDLKSKIIRLNSEIYKDIISSYKTDDTLFQKKIYQELLLFRINQKIFNESLSIFNQRLLQKKSTLVEEKSKLKFLEEKLKLTEEEMIMKENIFEEGVGSKFEINLAKQKFSDAKQNYFIIKNSIPRLKNSILEANNEIAKIKYKYKSKAIEEINKVKDQLSILEEIDIIKQDMLNRTLIKSPIDGIIKQVLVNNQKAIIKSGQSIIEIIPTDNKLIIDTKISPSDIGFLYIGQKAIIRFTAYDFTIYGSLSGKIINISADTIMESGTQEYSYSIQIETDKSFLMSNNKKLKIIPGMTAIIDIIRGKETILNYILKPILRAKYNTFNAI